MDNLNNGFTNPNAPSNSTTQSSFGGVNPVQQYNQTNSVNDVATQNPVMDPMSAPQAPFGSTANPPMDDNTTSPASDDSYNEDLAALKALADELNAVQSSTPPPVQPDMNAVSPLGSADIEVGNTVSPMGTTGMDIPNFDNPVVDTPLPPVADTTPFPMDAPVVEPTPAVGNVAPFTMDTPLVEPTPMNNVPSFDNNVTLPNVSDVPAVEPTPIVDNVAPFTMDTPVVEPTPMNDVSSFDSSINTPIVSDIPAASTEMDVNALSSDPWATPSPVVEESPMPMQDVSSAVDSSTMASDLEALGITSQELPSMDSNMGMGSTDAETLPPMAEESTPADSAPAFANMPSDLSQPLSSVQGELPVVENKEEVVNEDIVNTLPPKEEGKEGNILIIVLVVLIVALIAAIGYFAYQIFLS